MPPTKLTLLAPLGPRPFDESDLEGIATSIRDCHGCAIASARTAVGHAIECGRLLSVAKSLVSHGQWLPWLAEHTEINPQTAQRWMRLAKADPADIADRGIADALGAISHSKKDASPVTHSETMSAEEARHLTDKAKGHLRALRAETDPTDAAHRSIAQCLNWCDFLGLMFQTRSPAQRQQEIESAEGMIGLIRKYIALLEVGSS